MKSLLGFSRTILLLPLAFVVYGCGSSGPDPHEAAPPPRSPVAVEVGRVEVVSSGGRHAVTGTVRSRTVTTVASKVMGQVLAVNVSEGDSVRPGQLLVRIDDRDASAQLEQAEAALSEAHSAALEADRAIEAVRSSRDAAAAQSELAETTFERFRSLFERKSVSHQEYDEASSRQRAAAAQLQQAEEMLQATESKREQVNSRIRQAEAAVRSAQTMLSYAGVSAPVAGVISEKKVEVGQMTIPGQPLLTIENNTSYEVVAAVEESRLQQVSTGEEVAVQIEALGLQTTGTIFEIVPTANPATRSFPVKAALPPHPGLRSGLFATIFLSDPGRSVLTLPAAALVRKGQLLGVYVIDDQDRARFRLIRAGREIDGRVEALSGVVENERVVVNPPLDIGDGVPVRVSAASQSTGPEIDS
jgi:multidrug efflux pump subunit AcrA (membrane-fusion protein)